MLLDSFKFEALREEEAPTTTGISADSSNPNSRVFRVIDVSVAHTHTRLVLKTSPHAPPQVCRQAQMSASDSSDSMVRSIAQDSCCTNTSSATTTATMPITSVQQKEAIGLLSPPSSSSLESSCVVPSAAAATTTTTHSSPFSSSLFEEQSTVTTMASSQSNSASSIYIPSERSNSNCTFHCSMIHAEWQTMQSILPHKNIVSIYSCFKDISGVLPAKNSTQLQQHQHDKKMQSGYPDQNNDSNIQGQHDANNTSCCALLMEEAEMDLFDFVQKTYWSNRRANIHRVIDLFRQVALGLDFLHCSDFAHNDIKSENILLFANARQAKITDFGLATRTTPSTMLTRTDMESKTKKARYQAERWSMRCLSHAAPEIIETLVKKVNPFDEQKADVFAFGVSFFESVFGLRPIAVKALPQSDPMYKQFATKKAFTKFWKTNQQIQAILREINDGSFGIHLLFDLLQRTLIRDPSERISSAELLTHPLFG